MEITPFGINMLIKPIEANTILKSSEVSLCEYGDVLAVGSLVTSIKVGDVIAFTKWGTKHVEINNEKHYFIPEDDRFILGTITMPR